MATEFVYKNSKIYSGAYDISGATNELSLGYEYDEVEMTAMGDACRHALPGLAKLSFDLQGHGYSGTGEVEDVLTGRVGTAAVPMTWCPLTGAVGEAAYFAETLELGYTLGGSVGEVYAYTAKGMGEDTRLIRGTILGVGSKGSTGNSAVYELGDVGAAQYLYGCLHVTAVSGTNPTLVVTVRSDDAEGFSDPATRLTFAQKTAAGSQFITPVAGQITDTYWRATWTVGGTDTPTFAILLSVGIF